MDDVVYFVAPAVTLYVNDGTTFRAGDVVTPEDFESLVEFKGLLAAGKIVGGGIDPAEPDGGETRWNGWSVDDELSGTSPNPVSGRALAKIVESLGGEISQERSRAEEAENAVREAVGTVAEAVADLSEEVLYRRDSLTEEQVEGLLSLLGTV